MLYLVRHGDAVAAQEDAERPLSSRGREEVRLVGETLRALGPGVQRIAHSGRARARETAERLAAALEPEPSLEVIRELQPNDHPAAAARLAVEFGDGLVIVGHMPHLSRLASLLLFDAPEREVADLETGSVVALARVNGSWQLRWILAPRIVAAARA